MKCPRILKYFLKLAGWCFVYVTIIMLTSVTAPVLTANQSDASLFTTSTFANNVDILTAEQLGVPYIEQGNTNWCFETSLSMVAQYYGKHLSPADIAKGLGARPKDGLNFFDMFFGRVDSYLAKWSGFSFEHHIGSWNFCQYVNMIDKNTPVIVSTFSLPGHTIVVVGYADGPEGQYLYVHDPSGYLSRCAWQTNAVKYTKVSWSVFSKSHWTELVLTPAN
jgi:ABC-type bacteriocin/lantibiotic exporter with double-glycine peptidase domain